MRWEGGGWLLPQSWALKNEREGDALTDLEGRWEPRLFQTECTLCAKTGRNERKWWMEGLNFMWYKQIIKDSSWNVRGLGFVWRWEKAGEEF